MKKLWLAITLTIILAYYDICVFFGATRLSMEIQVPLRPTIDSTLGILAHYIAHYRCNIVVIHKNSISHFFCSDRDPETMLV